MKKILSILAVFAMTLTSGILLAACGGGDSNTKITAGNGFVYTLNNDKQSYSLTGYDRSVALQAEMVVANEIQGKPVTQVKNAVFYDDNTGVGNSIVKTLTIPDNVQILGDSCFRGLTALETVNIGSGLRSLDDINQTYNEFNPASVFLGCENITTFNVSPSNTTYRAEGSCLIELQGVAADRKGMSANEYDKLVVSGKGNVIPTSVQIIGDYCFANKTTPVSNTIPTKHRSRQ